MCLLFLNHNYEYSGTYYRAMPIAQQLGKRGHEVTLLLVSGNQAIHPTWTRDGLVRVGKMPNLVVAGTGEGYGLLDTPMRCLHTLLHHYDIVHSSTTSQMRPLPGFLHACKRGACLVADWGDWWGGPGGINDVPGRSSSIIRRFEVLGGRALQTVGGRRGDHQLRAATTGDGAWMQAGPRCVDPTGAPTDRIRPMPVATAREELGVPIHRRIVGFIGMGQEIWQRGMQALQHLADVWLMVVGKTRSETHNWPLQYGVAKRVWQTGFVPDERVGVYLGLCRCYVSTARGSGGQSRKVPEQDA